MENEEQKASEEKIINIDEGRTPEEGASSAPQARRLSREDLHLASLFHHQKEIATLQHAILLRDQEIDRLKIAYAEKEMEILKLRAQKLAEERTKSIAEKQKDAREAEQALGDIKKEWAERFGIKDISKMTYDRETGKINILP